jgi:acyl-CoA thioesterase
MDPQQLAETCARIMFAEDRATQGMDIVLEHIAPGQSTMSMSVTAAMCNGHGTCHGGFIFALADSAFAFACNSHGQRAVAQHAGITYIQPAQEAERLTATAVEVSRRGRGGIYDVTVTNTAGDVVAEFRGHSRTIKGTIVPMPAIPA